MGSRQKYEAIATEHGKRRQAERVKRMMDIALALLALIVLSPLLALTAAILLVAQGRPVLFRQMRPGLGEVPFTIFKFRTMRALHAGEDRFRSDRARVTPIGRFLRSASLDELPELWNVIRGDMSLVGPRPLLMEYLPAYAPSQRARHHMRPGITSWAAVNGRHAHRFAERVELDVWYVEHWSLRLDGRILLMTIGQVLRRSDVATTQDPVEIGFPLPEGPNGGLTPGTTVPPVSD